MTVHADEAAIQVDTYLDELLATRSGALLVTDDAATELAHVAAVVRDALVRFHPSFRFEENLAARLRAVATGTSRAATLVRFPAPAGSALVMAGARAAGGSADPAGEGGMPTGTERGWVLVGGAIASGVSLVAGVLLARRRSRDHRWERLA